MTTFVQDTVHPDYAAWRASWKIMRDCFDGDEAIKEAGEEYLPTPSGMAAAPNPAAAAAAYRKRAEVPDLVAPTSRGLTGVIHHKPSTYELGGKLDHLVERATKTGQTLDAFHRRITRDVLVMGRFGALVDAPLGGGDPFLAGYTAEAIRDWDTDDDGNLIWLVLDESTHQRNPTVGTWERLTRYRVLELAGGSYVQTLFEGAEGGLLKETIVEPTGVGGKPLDFIPFVFVGTNDLLPEPDDIPLYGVAKKQLSIYRMDADYRHALFLTAQPTPVAIGVAADDEVPRYIGSSAAWLLPEGGDAKMLEFTGQGVAAMRTAMQDDLDQAIAAGASLLDENKGEAESGEALRVRRSTQTATIRSISQNVGAGLEAALRFAARMIGVEPTTITVKPNLDFVEARMSPEDRNSLVESWLKGAISRRTLFWNLQRGGVIRDDVDFETETREIEEEAPGLGDLIGGGDPNPQPPREDDEAAT